MKLYYHKTDGGAEYYCVKHVDGSDEGYGAYPNGIIRTDGNEIEIFTDRLHELGIKLVIDGKEMI